MARLLLTRSMDDNAALGATLAGLGHEPIAVATTQIRALPLDAAELQRDLALADVLALTSRNGAQAAIARIGAPALQQAQRAGLCLAVVGSATAAVLQAAGMTPDLVAEPATGAGLAVGLIARLGSSARALVLHGDRPRPELFDGLRAAGWSCLGIEVYRNEPAAPPEPAQIAAAARAELALIFAPSAAERLYSWMPQLRALPTVAVGPTTADALVRWHGVSAVAVAEGPGLPALLAAIDAARARHPEARHPSNAVASAPAPEEPSP